MRTKGDTPRTPVMPGRCARLTIANVARSTRRKRRACSMQIECGCDASLRRTVPDEHSRLQAIQRGTAARNGAAEIRFAARDENLSLTKWATLLVRILLCGVLALTLAAVAWLGFLVFFGVLVP